MNQWVDIDECLDDFKNGTNCIILGRDVVIARFISDFHPDICKYSIVSSTDEFIKENKVYKDFHESETGINSIIYIPKTISDVMVEYMSKNKFSILVLSFIKECKYSIKDVSKEEAYYFLKDMNNLINF